MHSVGDVEAFSETLFYSQEAKHAKTLPITNSLTAAQTNRQTEGRADEMKMNLQATCR